MIYPSSFNTNRFTFWSTITLLITLLVCSAVAYSQELTVAQKKLSWHSSHSVEKHSGTSLNVVSQIEVHAGVSVDLVIQEQTISFTIASITGNWQSENVDGSLEYVIKYDNTLPGKMIITRSGGQTVISIDMTESKPDGINFDFQIDQVTNN